MSRQAGMTYEFGPFRLDLAEHRLLRDGRPVPLTPKVFEILRVLVENAGHLVEKERLLREIWAETFVEEANLSRGISVLRKALADSSADRYIETMPKRGYRFVAPVRELGNGAAVTAGRTRLFGVDDRPNTLAAWMPRGLSLRRAGTAAGAVLTIAGVVYAMLARSDPKDEVVAAGASIHRQVTFTGKETAPALSPDGSRIAYVSIESPHRRVMVQDLGGGRPVEVFTAPEAGALRWSPDGSELMFWARGEGTDGVFIAPSSGGGARKVATGLFVGCWSPDGSTIALALFVAGKIMFLDRLGEMQRSIPLQGTLDWIWDMDWSPVHDRLLFVANDDRRRAAIWTIRPDGSAQTKILTADTEIPSARWAPAGDAIYYFGRVNQTLSLYRAFVHADRRTSEPARAPLLSGLESDGALALSADGNRLVYARAPYHSNLWLVEAVDSGSGRRIQQTQLTHGTSVIERPRVSPDGTSIVFNMGYESRANLYVMPATGGAPKQLTFLNAFNVGGAWSADGRSVAFASTEGGKARVWVVNADGGSTHPISSGDVSDSFEIAWAPGRHILYQQAGNQNFYLLDPETRQERLLIRDGSVGWVGPVVYSPDGKKIAVPWNRRHDRGLWVIDSGNSRETLIYPSDAYSDPFPIGWSADGSFIYAFDGKRAANRGLSVSFAETVTDARILKVPLHGGRPETILSLPFEEIGSVTMFPDGRRFLCTVYSSRSDVWVVENFDVSAESRMARRSRTADP